MILWINYIWGTCAHLAIPFINVIFRTNVTPEFLLQRIIQIAVFIHLCIYTICMGHTKMCHIFTCILASLFAKHRCAVEIGCNKQILCQFSVQVSLNLEWVMWLHGVSVVSSSFTTMQKAIRFSCGVFSWLYHHAQNTGKRLEINRRYVLAKQCLTEQPLICCSQKGPVHPFLHLQVTCPNVFIRYCKKQDRLM